MFGKPTQSPLSLHRRVLTTLSVEQEGDLLTSKVLRLEDSVEDLKIKLTAAMSDKDRLLQVSVHPLSTS